MSGILSANTNSGDDASCSSCQQNVGKTEKWASVAGGVFFTLKGLSHGGVTGLLSTGLGVGLLYRGLTGHCHLYDQLGIDTATRPESTVIPAHAGVHVKKSMTIAKPVGEVFRFWDQLERLPEVMTHITKVERTGDKTSHWVAEAPLGFSVEWDAEVFNRVEDELIAWRSLPGSLVQSAGSVRFQTLPHDRGTAVTLTMKYNPPGGQLTDSVAWLFGRDLASEIEGDLRNLKRLLETGELPTVEGQPHGSRRSMMNLMTSTGN